ncbi:MAG TPA: tRNA (adenosine(37)-N6)-threonylcarbamoyltransferase complex ATPase subunit type 1 TsaE [Clostridiaceae bacterium]|nr:tRNA (adenosine(37)-N6)-threonylcarbamoyltransferase complex ATPase subunit type 1 TsaE [Clostridiaceae bacterium]
MIRIKTCSAEQTVNVGKRLGQMLKQGDIICLIGDLGAGKTAFTGGIADALGITGYITSPTFTIINEYEGKIPLYHFDVYRIADPEELYELGFDEYIDGDGIVVIEWADLIKEVLPSEYIQVTIEKDTENGENERIITIEFKGGKNEKRLEEIKALDFGGCAYEGTCS